MYKPSPLTPLTATLLADLAVEVGIPNGVLNVIQGDAVTGQLLASHPDIAKVSFTGSVAGGKKVCMLG